MQRRLEQARGEARAGRWPRAEALCREALSETPDDAPALRLLGHALRARGAHGEAAQIYARATALVPDDHRTHYNLGNALRDDGRPAEALASYRRAVELAPGHVPSRINLATALADTGDLASAREHYERALELAPDDAHAHWNFAQALLLDGALRKGFDEYRWRWRHAGFPEPRRRFDCPALAVSRSGPDALAGMRIFLHCEQGLGDTLQFVRYAPVLEGLGARVVAAVPSGLRRLLASVRGAETVTDDTGLSRECDAHLAMLDAPVVAGTTLETVPWPGPYIEAEADRIERWRPEIMRHPGLRVGLAWQGNPDHPRDAGRSLDPRRLAPLLDLPDVTFFSLQTGPAAARVRAIGADHRVVDPGPGLDAGPDRFVDTAAIMSLLDAVVGVDSAPVHLAGAMARPTYVLLRHVPDWRWLLGREDSPWYPSATLCRQRSPGDWESALDGVVEALRSHEPAARGR